MWTYAVVGILMRWSLSVKGTGIMWLLNAVPVVCSACRYGNHSSFWQNVESIILQDEESREDRCVKTQP